MLHMCHGQARRYIEDGHPTFNRNPYNGYINPYYWVDDHPLLYGNNRGLDPDTYRGLPSYIMLINIIYIYRDYHKPL